MKSTFTLATILSAAIFSSVTQGAPTSHLQQTLDSTILLQRRNDCPPCWDSTKQGCKPESYITKQASDDQTSLYYTCSPEDRLTTYYTCDGGCSGDGVCNNGQLYGYYAYEFVVPVGEQTVCAWTG